MFNRILVAAIALVVIVSGCASIMSGTTQKVTFDSEPPGATVTIGKKKKKDGKDIMVESYNAGVTPLVVELGRGNAMVEISKEGYQSQKVELKKTMNPWVWGDVALTSLLSTSIDTSTGACHQYKPGQYLVTLASLDGSVPMQEGDAPAEDGTVAPEDGAVAPDDGPAMPDK